MVKNCLSFEIFRNVGQKWLFKERVVTLDGQGLPLLGYGFPVIVHRDAVIPGSSGREADEPFTTLIVPSK